MPPPATVEGHERLRLFVGLPVPSEAAGLLWQRLDEQELSGVRRVPPEELHVTLAFLGSRPRADLETVAQALEELAGFPRPSFEEERYRETRSVGMVVLRDEDGRGAALAAHLQGRLAEAGILRPEGRPWLPHVTVVRFRAPPRLRWAVRTGVRFSPSDAAAYLSVLRSTGAQYEIVHRTKLGR